MNAIVPFAFEDHLFRVLDRDGEPWFFVGDACRILGLSNPSKTVAGLADDEKGLTSSETLGGPQKTLIVSEGGLYTIILRCREAMAAGSLPYRFRRWLTGEVLPTLRRTGRYAMPGATTTEPGQDTEYRRRLDTVSEARRLYGPARARLLYERLGLPEVPELPQGADPEPIVEGSAAFDPEAAIATLRAFLQAEGAAFVPAAEAGNPATWERRGVRGFRHADGDYLMPLATWRAVLGAEDARAAAKAVARAGWLVRDREGRHARVERIGRHPTRVYRIRAAFLAEADA